MVNPCAGVGSTTPKQPYVAVVGGHSSGKKSLIRRLVSSGCACPDDNSPSKKKSGDLPPTCSWEIDTKYYKVCVTLGSVSAEETPRDRKIPGGGLCEALVLVVDASSRESWVRARKWAATRSAEALDGLDVKLCVLNKFDLAARKGGCDWIGEAEDWCLDNFFELIKVSCKNAEMDEALGTGDNADDPQGVARVVEALQSNMWTGMTMKERNPFGGAAAPASGSCDSAAGEQAGDEAAGDEAAGVRGESDSGTATGGDDTGAEAETGGGGMFDGMQVMPEQTRAASGPPLADDGTPVAHGNGHEGGASKGASGRPEEDPEAELVAEDAEDVGFGEMDQMEELIAKASHHRAMLAQLPDKQRREKAADIALQLMTMMGLEMDDDEDDD